MVKNIIRCTNTYLIKCLICTFTILATGLRVKDTFEELGLPYVYNYDEKKYSEMKESVLEDNMQTFVDHLNTLINYHKIDIMVFDFLFIEVCVFYVIQQKHF